MGILTKIATFLRKCGKEGQHTIEYAVLMILIMAGVIVMGRYVIRSWNANLKGWEDSAIDSFEDPLFVTPSISIPGCTANPETPIGCGAQILNVCSGALEGCAETEMTFLTGYSPPGCQCPSSPIRCQADPCCCTTPVAVACGAAMSSGTAPPACSNTGLTPTTAAGCPYGFMGYSTQCGGTNYVGCAPDPSCLTFCNIANLTCTTDGTQTCSFPTTPGGSNGTSSCPIGYLPDPAGPPTAPCDISGNWGSVTNLCWRPCGDGTCDGAAGENCFSCPQDCGAPVTYGGYTNCPVVCGNGSCETGEFCFNCPQDCTQTCITIPGFGTFCFPCS